MPYISLKKRVEALGYVLRRNITDSYGHRWPYSVAAPGSECYYRFKRLADVNEWFEEKEKECNAAANVKPA